MCGDAVERLDEVLHLIPAVHQGGFTWRNPGAHLVAGLQQGVFIHPGELRERLTTAYPGQARLHWHSAPGAGTRALLTLPLHTP